MKINIPRMLLYLRNQLVEGKNYPEEKNSSVFERVAMKCWRACVANPLTFGLANRIGRALQIPLARGGRLTRLPPPLSAWTKHRSFPAVASRPFRSRWKDK